MYPFLEEVGEGQPRPCRLILLATWDAIQGKRIWAVIAAEPEALKAEAERRAWSNLAIVAGGSGNDAVALLKEAGVPSVRNVLIVGKAKGQVPVVDGSTTEIGNDHIYVEASLPL